MKLGDLVLEQVAQRAFAWTMALVKSSHLEIIPVGHNSVGCDPKQLWLLRFLQETRPPK